MVKPRSTTKNGLQSVEAKCERLQGVVARLVETCKNAIRHIEEDEYRSQADRAMSDELMAAIWFAETGRKRNSRA
jgi:hypothetical protein